MLNNPYYLYPGYPFSGYFDFENYNINLIKLYEDLLTLYNTTEPILLHFSIGSAIEEYDDVKTKFQWRQLFPYHLENAMKTYNKLKIIHYIISPSPNFKNNSDTKTNDNITNNLNNQYIPSFVNYSDIKFKEPIINNIIHADKFNFITKIYYTMMPTVEHNNAKSLEQSIEKGISEHIDIEIFRQTNEDIIFIKKFYDLLFNLLNKIRNLGGCTTCFSYAVFNEFTPKNKYKNYIMFKEIIDVFGENNNKSMLCEWRYFNECYIVLSHTNNICINYLKPDSEDHSDAEQIIINNKNNDKNYNITIESSKSLYKKISETKIENDLINYNSLFETIIFKLKLDTNIITLRRLVASKLQNLFCSEQFDISFILNYYHLQYDLKKIFELINIDKNGFIKIYLDSIISGSSQHSSISHNIAIGGLLEIFILSDILDINIILDNSQHMTDIYKKNNNREKHRIIHLIYNNNIYS